ncbi:ornithine carbamoyltransferase [Methanoculleus sp. FWC-SCC1]|uniref:Ornithine carbamoyltransferase n=1 Tax=Methanoculleus frigidifontis TaxID=2584085 RepID=A0ABT8M6C4_9EURY|nr:ornithine carbamoyltransferase [Methanoculleus sp. FWC-SCC1]MDN7023478.1 ornithine carbamoyltransferase [Methanoculleus sp. FWC-SCC1]
MKKDFLSIADLTADDLNRLIGEAERLKALKKEGAEHALLQGRSLAMIFEKASTRTRLSFEVGMTDLGGHALFLNPHDMQLGRGEEIRDTARVLARYVDAVMIRAYHHEVIEEFARYTAVPVINGLSDKLHPCQVLADILTIRERFGSLEGLRLAWIGDGNNVCNSLLLSSALTGMEIAVASPRGYQPKDAVVEQARSAGAKISIGHDPAAAVADADILYTDIWVSMGDEAERAARLRAFAGYTITTELIQRASPDAVVMHCLPAHRGEEITDEAIESPQSIVWDQAENRLHAQKALLVDLIGTGGRE